MPTEFFESDLRRISSLEEVVQRLEARVAYLEERAERLEQRTFTPPEIVHDIRPRA